MTPSGASTYLTQDNMTASPALLVAKLYEAAIASLNKAVKAIEDGEIEARWRANRRAIEIIEHLLSTLDRDRGGEVADNLYRLYTFSIAHLALVDVHNDPAPARAVIRLLEPLAASWRELADSGPETALAATPGASAPVAATPPPAPTAVDGGPAYGRDRKTQGAPTAARIIASA